MENCRQPATRARSAGPHAPTRLRPLLPAAPRFPPPEPAAAWLAESSRGRRFPPPARGEPRGQDGEGGRGAQRWPEAGGECPQEALAGAGATGRPRTLPRRASRVSRVAARQPPRGAEAAPGTPSSARTHALLPPPYGNLQPPQSDTSKIPRPGRSPSPPFPGSGPAAGIWAGERIPRSSDGPGEEGNSEPPHPPLSFPPGRAGGRRGRPLPCPAERSQGDLDSAAKFSSGIIPSAPWPGSALGQTRCPAPGLRSAGTRERSWVARPPQPGSPPLTHALPPLRLKRGSGCPRSGSPTPSQPAARGIPAAPLRRSRRSRRSRSCSPPPPRAAAAAPITTRRV